jgi:hypothetical protein
MIGHWCQGTLVMRANLVFLPPRCAVWSLSSGLTAVTADTTSSHRHCRKLPAVGGEPSGSSKARSVHAASPMDVPQNILPARHFSILPVRSPELLVFPISNKALPQTVSRLEKAVLVFPSWSHLQLEVEVAVDTGTSTGRCVSVVRWEGLVFWLVVAVAWGYVWLEYKLCVHFLPHPIRSRTNLDVSK